jgi:uncharacterized protein (TIGR03435 family)
VRPHSPQDNGPPGRNGGPGTRDPEHYFSQGVPLRIFLCTAFAVADCQQQISGPGWIDSEKYDIAAKVPPGTSKEQFQKMLQNLLTERFHLVLHDETRNLPVYELVIAKNGLKIKEPLEAPPNTDPPRAGPPPKVEHDEDGFPKLPPGVPALIRSFQGSVSHWAAQQQTMSQLAAQLSRGNLAAGRQVIDKTGLTGKYDFKLVYTVPGAPTNGDPAASILEDALEQQLGLKLVSSKVSFDFVIVDSGERVPSEN